MNLLSITGNTQSTVIGVLLILSVLIPNLAQTLQARWSHYQLVAQDEERKVNQAKAAEA
jgi:hypothetical protein